jgi:hypothetical protein
MFQIKTSTDFFWEKVHTLDDIWKVDQINFYSMQTVYCILLCVGRCNTLLLIESGYLMVMLCYA